MHDGESNHLLQNNFLAQRHAYAALCLRASLLSLFVRFIYEIPILHSITRIINIQHRIFHKIKQLFLGYFNNLHLQLILQSCLRLSCDFRLRAYVSLRNIMQRRECKTKFQPGHPLARINPLIKGETVTSVFRKAYRSSKNFARSCIKECCFTALIRVHGIQALESTDSGSLPALPHIG